MSYSDKNRNLKHISRNLTPSISKGLLIVFGVFTLLIIGISFSLAKSLIFWFIGQIILAVNMLQWFVLLHETGHNTLFPNRRANLVIGHISGFFSVLPFHSWQRIHSQHHKWTGWQDLDPTTKQIVPRKLNLLEKKLMNFCWKFYLPLFSILYRINNYWNLPRLFQLFTRNKLKVKMAFNVLIMFLLYVLLVFVLGIDVFFRLFGLSFFMHLVLSDPILISQHTHVTQNLSGEKDVKPFYPEEQAIFTRSLIFPKWISDFILFNFDAHEIHHMFPTVPGYLLSQLPFFSNNQINWIKWLKESKQVPAHILLFKNRRDTGYDF